MCIYDIAFNKKNDRQLFWKYIKALHQSCYNNVNEDCSKIAHKDAGLNYEDTDKCFKDSFTKSAETSDNYSNDDVRNTLIDKEKVYRMNYGSLLFPSVVINNQTYVGRIEVEGIFNAICAGFQDKPRMCKTIL